MVHDVFFCFVFLFFVFVFVFEKAQNRKKVNKSRQ